MINPFRRSQRTRAKRMSGQAMVEYTVILAFGVLVLLGPGGDPGAGWGCHRRA